MQLKSKLTKCFLTLAFAICLLFPQSTNAQNKLIDVTVSPIYFDYTNNSGETIKDKIRIRNNTSTNLDLKINIGKLGPTEETGSITILDPRPEDSYIQWLKFDSPIISARPQEWTDIPFTITIPGDAAFGYYWAVSLEQTNSSDPNNNTAKVSGAAAIPILLNVKKDGAKTQASVVEFKPKSFINQFLPVEFETKIKNTGNVHIRPRGNIFISGQGTKDVAILDVNSESGSILPNLTRLFETSWIDGFIVNEPVMEDGDVKLDDKGKPKTELRIHWDKLTHIRYGPYTATLVMVFDDGTRDVLLESKADFWVIPYTVIGIGLIVLISAFLIIKFTLRSYINSQLKKRSR